MIKLTTQEALHIEDTLRYLLEVISLDEEGLIPEDLPKMTEESLMIIRSVNIYSEMEMLNEEE